MFRPASLRPQRGSGRNQPFFIIKAQTTPLFAQPCSAEQVGSGVPVNSCLKKKEVVARLMLKLSASPAFIQSRAGRAYTRETLRLAQQNPRQLKPILRGPRPPQVPAKRSTAMQSCCRPGSVRPRGSLEPPTHTPDIDWRCSQSNCNPGKDTRYSTESVGASGTMQHRQVVLKRWEAYCHLVFWEFAGSCCTLHVLLEGCPRIALEDASPVGDSQNHESGISGVTAPVARVT